MKPIRFGITFFLLLNLPQTAVLAQIPNLYISELMAVNDTTLMDEDSDYSDWLEIHNAGAVPLNLDGWHLTDDAMDLEKWEFPAVQVPVDGYMVVFASDKDRAVAGSELHLNLKLTSGGEYLALVEPDGMTIAHEYSPAFPEQLADISYGIVSGTADYMTTPTPGSANIEGGLNRVASIDFSTERGFYDQTFQVALSTHTADSQIRFTLDGSTPTASHGTVYTIPFNISTTTVLRAAGFKTGLDPSPVQTHSYLFLDDVLTQSYPGGGWPAPGTFGPRNQLMDYDMDSEVINDPLYMGLVDDALLSIPTISLVTDLDNLFNPSTNPAIGGIYANPNQDGEEWERPVSMELIHPDGTPGFQTNAGIRIRGGWSRGGGNPKHAFRFFFRGEYGDPRLNYPLFGEEGVNSFDKIDLRCSTDYSWTLGDADGEGYGSLNTQTRDVFCRDTQRDMGQPYTRSRQYHVYLNGLYWGIYQSQERSEAAFAESYLGGDETEYDAINRRSHSEGAVDGNLDAWTDLWEKSIAGFATDASYYAVQGLNPDGSPHPVHPQLVDLENVADYMMVIYYSGSFDTPVSWWWSPDNSGVNNIWCLYNRANPEGFKYFCHDCEHTLLAHLTGYPSFPWSIDRTGPFLHSRLLEFSRANPQSLHQNLLAHPAYQKFFQDKIYTHFFNDGALTPSAAAERFQDRIDEIDMAIIAESARWGDAQQEVFQTPRTKDDDFTPTVNGILNEFMPNRTGVVLEQLKTRGWYPNAQPPVLQTDAKASGGGHVPTGAQISFTNPNGFGKAYYTTDGSDPWLEPKQRKVTQLLSEDADKRVLIPSGPILNWTDPGFDDSGWTDGSIDGVLEFDGSDDYVDCGTSPGSASALTVAFWIYANFGDEYVVLDKFPDDSSGVGWRVRLRDESRMRFRIGSNGSKTTLQVDRAYLPRTWVHMTCTFDSGTAKVYFDGLEMASQSGISQSVANNTTPLRMAFPTAVDTDIPLDGRLNDVRIYDRALNPTEVADLADRMEIASGLTAHWKLDETTGTTATDSSGNGHHGTLTGTPTWRIANAGGVGYDVGDPFDMTIATDVETEMEGQNPSAYIRIPFTVAANDLIDFQFLNLKVKFDGGFVAHLNGQKVAEAGAPATPEWNSTATAERDDDKAVLFRNYDLSPAIGSLVAGTNLLAIQGLNSASDDEDSLLSIELVAQDLHPDEEINPEAVEYSGPITLNESTMIGARTLDVGEWSPLEKATYAVGPVTESLRITEIHYHPDSASEAEFIEIKNIGSEAIELNLVRFSNGIDFTFPSLSLAPGQLVVVVADLPVFESVYGTGINVAGVYKGRLANNGEKIHLEDALGATVLEFSFDDVWHPSTDGGNRSLTLLDPVNSDLGSWGLSTSWVPSSIIGGTPGEEDPGPFGTATPTHTNTATPTQTSTSTYTLTPSPSPADIATLTPTPSFTSFPSDTPTSTTTPTSTITNSSTATPSPSPTNTISYDWTGEGDVDAKDLILILAASKDPGYLYGFAVHWLVSEKN